MRLRGTGSIFPKKGTRNLQISYYGLDGKQVQESCGSPKKSVAEAMLRDRLSKVEQGLPVGAMKSWSYEDAREALIRDWKAKGNKGLKKYKRRGGEPWALLWLDDWFKGRLMRTIDTDAIHRFIEHMQSEKKKNGTINRVVAHLSRMMHIGVRDGKLARVPYIPKLSEKEAVRTGFVEDAQFKEIRKSLPENLHPLMIFLYTTGSRVSAAKSIRWAQIEENGAKMYVRLPGIVVKNNEPLMLPLATELAVLLRGAKRNGHVFDATNLRREWDKVKIAVSLPDLLIHDLRRSGARNLRRVGVPESVIMKIGGWKTAAMFRRYGIVSTEELDDAMARLEGKTGT
jgi:integrase